MLRFSRWFVYHLLRAMILPWVRVVVEGRENLPKGGPLLVIGNHFSFLDGPLLYFFLPYRPLVFLAASDLVDRHHLGFLIDLFEAIPIRRGQGDREALQKAQAVLDRGGVLGVMPEGAVDPVVRNAALAAGGPMPVMRERRVAELVEPRPGAALLAVNTGATILPVGLVGAEQIMPNFRRLRRTTVRFIIGPTFGPLLVDPALEERARRERINELGREMMVHLAALLPPQLRGPFGSA